MRPEHVKERQKIERMMGCVGKEGFKTWQHAARSSLKRSRRNKWKVEPYRCRFCGYWHNG